MLNHVRVFTGSDDFRIREKVKLFKAQFQKMYPDGEIHHLEGAENKDDRQKAFLELENALYTPNLFGGKRLIFAENFWDKEMFEHAEKANLWKKLPDCADQSSLMIIETSIDKRLKGWKDLLLLVKVETFEPFESTQELIEWCEAYAQKQGGNLKPPTTDFLIDYCGRNLWNLTREIEKLCHLSEGEPITKAMIKSLCLPHTDTIIWNFLESISQKKTVQALEQFKSLLQSKTSPHEILPLLTREIRIHTLIKSALDHNVPSSQLASTLKLSPFVLQKSLPHSKSFSWAQLHKAYDGLFDIDQGIKTGKITSTSNNTGPLELAIEKWIIELTSPHLHS